MKKIWIIISLVFMLSGCGVVEDEVADINASLSEENIVDEYKSIYFDTSDLTYIGKQTQEFAIGYKFENESDNNPVLVYDQYQSDDGEIFSFDDKGRLCYYRNNEKIFYNEEVSEEKKLSEDELLKLSESIVNECTGSDTISKLASKTDDKEYGFTSFENENKYSDAIIKLNDYGKIRSLSVSYNNVSALIDSSHFESKINSYIKSIKSSYNIVDYNYTVRYEQVNNKIYAMYNCSFVETDGCEFCSLVGFTKEIPLTESQ